MPTERELWSSEEAIGETRQAREQKKNAEHKHSTERFYLLV